MKIEVKARGLREFRLAAKRIDSEIGKELRKVHLQVADLVADRSRAASPPRIAGAIGSRATQRAGFVTVRPRPPDALAQFLGAKRRTGWYAAPRYRNSTGRQFRPWVGNQWDPGERGGAPYFIGDAINDSVDDVIDMFGDGIERAAAKAF